MSSFMIVYLVCRVHTRLHPFVFFVPRSVTFRGADFTPRSNLYEQTFNTLNIFCTRHLKTLKIIREEPLQVCLFSQPGDLQLICSFLLQNQWDTTSSESESELESRRRALLKQLGAAGEV